MTSNETICLSKCKNTEFFHFYDSHSAGKISPDFQSKPEEFASKLGIPFPWPNGWLDCFKKSEYDKNGILNIDEAALFHKMTPNQRLKFNGENIND